MFILGIVVLLVIIGASCYFMKHNYGIVGELLSPAFFALGIVGLVLLPIAMYCYTAAGYQAAIINREYSTNYTQNELFFASDVIETVRELDRKRIELNGDLLK
jgi:hypothetical protein